MKIILPTNLAQQHCSQCLKSDNWKICSCKNVSFCGLCDTEHCSLCNDKISQCRDCICSRPEGICEKCNYKFNYCYTCQGFFVGIIEPSDKKSTVFNQKFCIYCKTASCNSCFNNCIKCEGIICSACVNKCDDCDEHICPFCTISCDACDDKYHDTCGELERCIMCKNKLCIECKDLCMSCGSALCNICIEQCKTCNYGICQYCKAKCNICDINQIYNVDSSADNSSNTIYSSIGNIDENIKINNTKTPTTNNFLFH